MRHPAAYAARLAGTLQARSLLRLELLQHLGLELLVALAWPGDGGALLPGRDRLGLFAQGHEHVAEVVVDLDVLSLPGLAGLDEVGLALLCLALLEQHPAEAVQVRGVVARR